MPTEGSVEDLNCVVDETEGCFYEDATVGRVEDSTAKRM